MLHIIYPGNIKLIDLMKKNLIRMNTPGFKNEFFILYDPALINNYEAISPQEIVAFERVLKNPRFCRACNDVGIKLINGNTPKCKITINDQSYDSYIKFEIKILGTGFEGRVGLIELKPIAEQGPTILVATNYVKKGFHSTNTINKFYHFDINIETEKRTQYDLSSIKQVKNNLFFKHTKQNRKCHNNRHNFYSTPHVKAKQ